MPRLRTFAKWAAIGIAGLAAVDALSQAALRDLRFSFYTAKLDQWVAAGAPSELLASMVTPSCGKLVMTNGSFADSVAFMTYDRSEFYFRVDVCVKMTENRVRPQIEFTHPELVAQICSSKIALFPRLCARSGLPTQ